MANQGWMNASNSDRAADNRDADDAESFVHGSRAAAIGPMNDKMGTRGDVFESESVLGLSTNK